MQHLINQIAIATKSAFRNFRKNSLYTSLNILGLALAYAVMILVAAYVYQESSYENFHQKADRIYRPTHRITGANDFELHFARIPVDFVNELPAAIPEIETLVRFQNQEQKYVRIGADRFKPKHAYTTDADVFQVFDLPLLKGNTETALSQPRSVVLTASTAQKYFSSLDVIGKELEITGDWSPEPEVFQVTGVLQDLPANTHLPIDLLFSFSSEEERSGWAYVYTLLKAGARIESVEAKIPGFIQERSDPEDEQQIHFVFQALKDIHLRSHLAREIQANGQTLYIRIFGGVALFVWIIALVNFTNLNTALAMGRGKEIGVRKVLGAGNFSLTIFSFTESIIYSGIALLLGGMCAWLCFPYFQQLTGVTLFPPFSYLSIGFPLLAMFTGLLAGILPMATMTGFGVLSILQTTNNWSTKGRDRKSHLRGAMIAIQFTATLVLIGSALVAYRQFRFIQQKNLGLKQEQILTIAEVPHEVKTSYGVFKSRLQEVPGVENVSACMQLPSSAIRDMGPVSIKGQDEEQSAVMMDMQIVDPNFIDMMGMELVAGKDFTREVKMNPFPEFSENLSPTEYLAAAPRQYLINESAAKQLGWNQPAEAIGQQVNWSIGPFELAHGPISGILKDFHQESLKAKIEPVIMTVEPLWLGNFLIKVSPHHLDATIVAIESTWKELFPYPFEYAFLDEQFDQLYQQDRVQLKLLSILALIAVFLSFLGVFSLLAYALERRSKELAIRRVIGADLRDLTQLLGKEYFWILGMATLIGIPVSYYYVRQWLDNFAYRIEVTPLEYTVAVLLLFILLFVTIYWQMFRATVENPVEQLRDE